MYSFLHLFHCAFIVLFLYQRVFDFIRLSVVSTLQQKGHGTLRHSNQANMLHDHDDGMHMEQHDDILDENHLGHHDDGMIDEHGQQHDEMYEGEEYQGQEMYQQEGESPYNEQEEYAQEEVEQGGEQGEETYAEQEDAEAGEYAAAEEGQADEEPLPEDEGENVGASPGEQEPFSELELGEQENQQLEEQ